MSAETAKQQKRTMRVLVVDDEKSIRVCVREFLTAAGYAADIAENAPTAKELLKAHDYDVIISDIVLPGISGVELLQDIAKMTPRAQVIMMTGEPTVETASEAVRAGARDYLTKPIGKDDLLRSVANAAKLKSLDDERLRLQEENSAYQKNLEKMVKQRTAQLRHALEGTIAAMASLVESRDPYTAGHQKRVAELAKAISLALGLDSNQIEATYHAALLHDLGKISVPGDILTYPSHLSDEAMNLVRTHVEEGARILSQVDLPWPIADIVLQHHERLDGSAYPHALKGDDIRLEARIIGVADTVEAMASHRPYRPAIGIDAALKEIEKNRTIHYDPQVVDTCLSLFREKGFTFSEP
jgi:putative nucleotidyltransferase with HDIG domain